MAGKQRPIDAPAPPWRLMPVTTDEVPIPDIREEEEPTAPPEDGIDKAELARQLAEKAKADLDAKSAEEARRKKEKGALAAELAASAKAKLEARKVEREKKAQLAKELVEKAKAKHTPGPAPEAPAPAKKAEPKKAEAKGKTPSLAQRASRPRKKKMSAKEALAAALAAEEATASAPKKKATAKKKAVPAKKSATADVHPAAEALAAILPTAEVIGDPLPVARGGVFVALWKAHLARARKAADPALVATATQLLRAVDQTELTALHAVIDGAAWAVWLDGEGTLIAAAQPAETYLKGL